MAERIRVTSLIGETRRGERPGGPPSPEPLARVAEPLPPPPPNVVSRQGFAAARATAAEYPSRLGTNPRLLRCPLGPRAVARLVPRRRRLRLRRDLPRPPFPFRRRVRLPARSGRAGGRARIFPGGGVPRGPL